MRNKTIMAILVLGLILTLSASSVMAAKPIIQADEQYLDISSGLYVLNGHVYVQVGNRIITAGTAKVDLTGMQVWGSGGITLSQDDVYFTGDTVYVYGNDRYARITGGVQLQRSDLIITADTVEYNWRDKQAVFSGHVRVQQASNEITAETIKYNTATNTWQVVQ